MARSNIGKPAALGIERRQQQRHEHAGRVFAGQGGIDRRTAPAGSRNKSAASGRAAMLRMSECVRAMNRAAPAPLWETSPSARTRRSSSI